MNPETEWHRKEIAWRRDRMVAMLDEAVRTLRTAPLGTQRKHADAVARDLDTVRRDLLHLLYEADDCFACDAPAEGSHRRV